MISFAGQGSYGLNMLRVCSKKFFRLSICYYLEDLNAEKLRGLEDFASSFAYRFIVSVKRKINK